MGGLVTGAAAAGLRRLPLPAHPRGGGRHPLRHQVVQARHPLGGGPGGRPCSPGRGLARRPPTSLVRAEHGFTANLPLADFARPENLFAYRYDGAEIEPEHGWPLRLVVPHLYFWKSVKWVRGFDLLDHDEPGFWERNGYHMYGDPWRSSATGATERRPAQPAACSAARRRSTMARIPPWRRYSTSTGVSTRAVAANSTVVPSARRAVTRTGAARLQAVVEVHVVALGAVEAQGGGVGPAGVGEGEDPHHHQVGAVDALEGLGQHRPHPEQVGALGRPVARRAHAVVLAGEHQQGSPGPAVRLGGVVHRLHRAVGEVGGEAPLGPGGQAVADAGVGEGAPDHHPVVAPARPVGVEVGGGHPQGDQVAAGGRIGRDRAGGADVVGGHRVAQGQQDPGAPDRGQRPGGRRRGRRRRAAPGCRCWPRPRRRGLRRAPPPAAIPGSR